MGSHKDILPWLWPQTQLLNFQGFGQVDNEFNFGQLNQHLNSFGQLLSLFTLESRLILQVLAAMAIAASTEEACKVRLNFAAYLSEGFRNREAMKVIKDSRASQPPKCKG